MDIISEQSSDAEYNQSSQSNKVSQFNAVSRKSQDGSFINIDYDRNQQRNFIKKNQEVQQKGQVKINCRFDNDDTDSLDEEIDYIQNQNPSYISKRKIKDQQYLISDKDDSDLEIDQANKKLSFGTSMTQQKEQSKIHYGNKKYVQNDNMNISTDSDQDDQKGIQKGQQYQQQNNDQYSLKVNNLKEQKFQNDFHQNTKTIKDQQIQGNQNQLMTKSITTFDKSISEIDLEESLQDPRKDTFYRLREDLIRQLDGEREKNMMMEQKLLSRDKSFFEIKAQFNELLFNYESKTKECEILRKNQNMSNGILNQSHHSIASCKTNKKSNTNIDNISNDNPNSIERKYNQLLSKYKNDFDNDSSEDESDNKIKIKRDQNTGYPSSQTKSRQYDEIDSISSRGLRKNSCSDNQSVDLAQQKKQQENDLLLRKIERQMAQISKLNKDLDDAIYENNKKSQKITDLELEISRISSMKDEKQENKIQQVKQNNSLLFSQLEEAIENNRLLQLEINELKGIIKQQEAKIKDLVNDENDNQALLEKAERLLKQFEGLKSENYAKNLELEKVQRENKELKEKSSDGRESQLRDFAEQQDNLIQRLSSELENQKADYQIQIDHAMRNILDIVKRLFGQRGDFLCSPDKSYFWLSEALGKEVSEKEFSQESERQEQQQQCIHFSDILKEVDLLQRDYERYKDFAKVFKDMIKSIAKNELNPQPTLKNCWKYFKWLYQHYIKLKLEDQMNQSTTSILLKMLKLSNEHEIIVAVQNLITQNDRLRHLQSIIAEQTPSQLPSQVKNTQLAPNCKPQQQQPNFNFKKGGKENKPDNNQRDIKNENDNSKRSKSPIQNNNFTVLNMNNNQKQMRKDISVYSPMPVPYFQGDQYTQQNQFSQNSILSTYRVPYSFNTQTTSTNMDTQFDSQSNYSAAQRSFQGEVRMNNNNSKNVNNFRQRGANQNNRSMPRLITNHLE